MRTTWKHPAPGVHPPGVLPESTLLLPIQTHVSVLLASESNAAQYKAGESVAAPGGLSIVLWFCLLPMRSVCVYQQLVAGGIKDGAMVNGHRVSQSDCTTKSNCGLVKGW